MWSSIAPLVVQDVAIRLFASVQSLRSGSSVELFTSVLYIGPSVVEHCAFSRSGCSDKALCKCSVSRSGSSVELFTSVLLYRSRRLSRSGSNVLGSSTSRVSLFFCLCLFQPRYCAVARSAPVFLVFVFVARSAKVLCGCTIGSIYFPGCAVARPPFLWVT